MSHDLTTPDRTRPHLRLVRPDSPTAPPGPDSRTIDAGAEALYAIECMSRRIDDLARAFNLPGPNDPADRRPRAA